VFYTVYSLLIGGGLFFGMLLLIEVGRWIGRRRISDDAQGASTGLVAIDAAVFSLLGLLITFTFSGAASRFDARRHLAIDETNAIGTAWLRIDMLPAEVQPDLRELFRKYVDGRLRIAMAMPDLHAAIEELRKCEELQRRIWEKSTAACRETTSPLQSMLVLPALNEMFDIGATRVEVAQIHPPMIIFVMLIVLSLASAVLAGYALASPRKRSWIHIVGLAAAISASVFVIIDLEYPRAGLIRLDAMDQFLIDLRQSMNGPT